jgi:Bcr/CflA subfamily drug resistance transporter
VGAILQKSFSRLYVVLMLAPMVMALPFAMDTYVPALPHMASLFHASASTMQLTLTLFMLTAGLVQLVIGPVSDRYGRKPIAYAAMAVFALGCLLCALSDSVQALIFFRIIQALGCCGMMVVAFAIVRDLYRGVEGGQVYSLLNGIISFSPMFAPFIGSYLDIHYDWPATFFVLLLLVLWAWLNFRFAFSETSPKYKQRLGIQSLCVEYKHIISNRIFLFYTVATATALSYLYLFCSISPYIIIRDLHIPEAHYGFYFCFMGVSLFIGSVLSSFVVKYLGLYGTVMTGFMISLAGGLMMSAWYFLFGLTIVGFIWPMLLVGIGGTFILGAGSGASMEPFSQQAGAAAALGGGFRFFFAGTIGAAVITQDVTSTLPLALPAVCFNTVGLIVFFYFRRSLALAQDSTFTAP